MRELPILMKPEMVRALLRKPPLTPKTQTRRINAPWEVGDRLVVKETYYRYGHWVKSGVGNGRQLWSFEPLENGVNVRYMDNPPNYVCKDRTETGYWLRPSLFMFRKDSRITLEVSGKHEEFLQDISNNDAKAEGVREPICSCGCPDSTYVGMFWDLWDSINAKPKPIMGNGAISHYVSYPWEDVQETRTYRGKDWFIHGNPKIWVTTFRMIECKT